MRGFPRPARSRQGRINIDRRGEPFDGEHRSLTIELQEKPPGMGFNNLLPMFPDRSVTHVPGWTKGGAPIETTRTTKLP